MPDLQGLLNDVYDANTHALRLGGSLVSVSASFTRPADTTAYAALDAISDSTSAPTVLTFANLVRKSGGAGYIVKARLLTDQSTNVGTYRLHLFHTAPTALNDNAPYTMLWTNRTLRLGHVDFAAAATEGTGSTMATTSNTTVKLAIVAATGSSSIYAILETLNGFTPASAQNFLIELTCDQS